LENNLKVFKSDRFDVEYMSNLSLFLYPESLLIFAKDQNDSTLCIHQYEHFSWHQLEQVLITDPLLKNNSPAKFYLHQPEISLVPGVFFKAGSERDYLAFATDQKPSRDYFYSSLDSNNLMVVSSIATKFKKIIEARFSEVSFHHGACSFLSYLFKERFNLVTQEILLSVYESQIYAAVFVKQELVTFNRFEITGAEDILKYISILIKQLSLTSKHVRVSIFGTLLSEKSTEEWGKTYFHNFRLLTPHANQNYSHGFKNIKGLNLFEKNWQFD